MFNQDVIAAVKVAKFCRVVVYPAVRGWSGERVQLEVADELSALGHTDCLCGAGHWLVIDMTPEEVADEVGWFRRSPVLVITFRSNSGDQYTDLRLLSGDN
ncbi:MULTISPECIES: hypothetical protein [unclassified Aeromonas]|uniref:hypothetical protein n=1 Tax=unclassified Aeromonas TaxID=257493 RepID=UPI00084B0206|nr:MULTISPECIES: hypothetical protein [unclassified Aeromonas]OEC50250.1 hypothetical protein A9G04_15885 [Aeromonas sp. ANNP30]OEC62615.1 hypothetical protein A9G49_18375 [Aeromonas sp. ANP5]